MTQPATLSRGLQVAGVLVGLASSMLLLATPSLSKDPGERPVPAAAPLKQAPTLPSKAGGGTPGVVGIVAGSLGDTEFRAADEIAAAVVSTLESGPNGEVPLRVVPIVSKGGKQAVRDVLTLPEADFGVAPALVLNRVQASGEFGNLTSRIVVVAPLYFEEVHLIAGPGVTRLPDLKGKLVSVGDGGSETEMIAREVLAAAGIDVRELHLGIQDALAAVQSGGIAAAFVVSGKPVDALKSLSRQKGIRLLALPLQVPPEFLPSALSAEDYPDLIAAGERVETLAVQNVLFAYNWPAQSRRGQLDEFFLKSLLWRLSDLQVQPRHPKWREVNVAGSVAGWRRLPAMEAWLAKNTPRAHDQALRDEFDQFLKTKGLKIEAANRSALLEDYIRWRNDPTATGSR